MSPAKSPRVTHAGATSGIPTCNECGQTFGRIWDLQRHQHSATVHKPQALRWRCGICKIAFTRRDSCLRHLDSQHGRQISYYEAWPAPV
ncbi:hypothetical protein BC835DRAFT_1378581 [Cytidiella melzeri]|nr:hypothetical protein BC835DRAFT_1378581 [Cytidiella melzeri]